MKKQSRLRELFRKILGGRTIRVQLYSVYMVAMVLPIVLLGLFLILNTHRLLSNYHADLMNSDNARVKNLMFEFTTQVRNLSENVIFDSSIQEVLSGEFDNAEEYRKKVNRISLLDSYRSTYVEISDISIYSDNPHIVNYKQFQQASEEIINSSWYQKASNQSSVFWTGLMNTSAYGTVSHSLALVRKIPLVNSSYNAVLVMRISDDYLRSSIENSSFETYLCVGKEKTFYSSKRSLTGEDMPMDINHSLLNFQNTQRIVQNDKICLSQVSTLNTYQSESKIYIGTINRDGYYDIWRIITVCIIILALAIIIPGFLIYFFTEYLTTRIDILRDEMHKASRQDYELIPVLHGKDEISEAHADLQIMVENIKEQESKAYESKLKEQELQSRQTQMEFKMLASQINPHFLYNTLETIRMKAFTAGDRQVAEAIKLLGKSMRYVLENTGTSETTLAKEMEHVEVYLKIQQLRFGDRFDFSMEVEDSINPEEIRMLPLLLQPLVENALIHGLENMENDGHVIIKIHPFEDNIFIDIIDNGEGISDKDLEQLKIDIETKDVSRNKSIGLYNINQRVKLMYGEKNPLIVDSTKGSGTRVRLTLPLNICLIK